VRGRFTTFALATIGALTAGALGIAVTLAASDPAVWPAWLRPFDRWGWWTVLALLLTAALLAAWQVIHQSSIAPPISGEPTAQVGDSGPVAGRDVAITGRQGPTAGRDVHAVTGGSGQTAGRDIIYVAGAPSGPTPDPTVLAKEVHWPTPDRTISNLPAPNQLFAGRQDLLARLSQELAAEGAMAVVQAKAVHGLGGVGKTHLVLEFAHRHAGDYDVVWWVTADLPATIPGQLAALARRLGIPEQAEQAETVVALLDELRQHNRWLLTFDNAEEPRDLRPYWPPGGGGHVLITSRNPNWAGLAPTVPIGVLARVEAIAFLKRRAGLDEQAANALAEALGDLPLALEQAAAYLEETSTSPSDYLALLQVRGPDLFALGQPATSEQTIATTWAVSLDRIRTTTPVAEDLLALCAFLGPDDLPRNLLVDHPEVLPTPLAAAVQDRLDFQQALAALRRYSLIAVTSDALSMHRLVQAVVRHRLNSDQEHQWAIAAARVVLAALPDDVHDFDAWPIAARLLPHVLTVTGNEVLAQTVPAVTVSLLNRASQYLVGRAEIPFAKPLAERALQMAEAELGARHPDTATSLYCLAIVLYHQGDLDHARILHERALAIREASLGADHLDTGLSLNDLAIVVDAQGDHDRARRLHERVLRIRETRRGPDHPHTASSLNNLGIVLYKQGDLDRPRILHERALTIREASLGRDHPYTAQSLMNLALVLAAQDDLDRARALLERALRINQARLGDQPETAGTLHNLALVVAAQGDFDRARTLEEQALAIRETRLGSEHLETASSLLTLALVLANQHDFDRARIHHERGLSVYEARLGPDHPQAVQIRQTFAEVMSEHGNGD
jgi:tetratricopeptide (TPR) repeat protein